ncbi:MAG: bacillithiol biosynthesis cysteine-adding enzyme BshC [Bacteroidetes bacterium]|nr:bacillithiol biosynthesis cysteine-adding enzyme BshC [Bacteroidota bacterium]
MKSHLINRIKSNCFSEIANTLVYDQVKLVDFIQEPFSIEAFEEQMNLKSNSFGIEQRTMIQSQLLDDYANYSMTKLQKSNLDSLLKQNTFTITTGHQLSLFTGPLYFVIKILHVIELCKELKAKYPTANFIPVFWMASEDHDYDEIKSFQLFNRTITWETEQTGAVGRMKTDHWSDWQEQVKMLFQNHPDSEVLQALDNYEGATNSQSTFQLVNHLFASNGLLVLDADKRRLKLALSSVFHEEIVNQSAERAVESQTVKLKNAGFTDQAHARPINFFYLQDGRRDRLKLEGDFISIGEDIRWTKDECLSRFKESPESFSPNVILRPLFQELILPNLCYVGGGGEMAYWLQLKGVFDLHKVPYPLIQVRNSLVLLDDTTKKKMETVGWTVADAFGEIETLKKEYVLNQSNDFDFSDVKAAQQVLENAVIKSIEAVDASMLTFGKAEMVRLGKQIDSIEQKLIRTEKTKHEKGLKTIEQIKDRLFHGGMQERSLNFFHFCADGKVFENLEKLRTGIAPFEKDLIVLEW